MKKLLFIVGMQKSGTSLLNRILMEQDFISNPFLPEGKFFWGDNPPFNPVDKPCGEIFQSYSGKRGHALYEEDFSSTDQKLLQQRIVDAEVDAPVILSKNPYNSVRLPWLKRMFPESVIVAMYRAPVSNVYSLLKKYHKSHVIPEDGWWGIKPHTWQNLVSSDKLTQCANQWNEVNKQLLNNRSRVDLFINYKDLCNDPNGILWHITSLLNIKEKTKAIPTLLNLDDEYLRGSRIESKNKEMRTNKGFQLKHLQEELEFPPFTKSETAQVKTICSGVLGQFLLV